MPRSFLVKKHHGGGSSSSSSSSSSRGYRRQGSETGEASWDRSKDSKLHSDIPYQQLEHPETTPQPELSSTPPSASSSTTSSSSTSSQNQPPSEQFDCQSSLSTLSLFGHRSEVHAAEACGSSEPCRSSSSSSSSSSWRDGLPPPALPLVALFPAILPGGGASIGGGRMECLDCHNEHLNVFGLAEHKTFQCEWSSKKYFSCKYCEKEYSSLGALKMHIRTHTLPCVCSLCGKAFSRPWLLQGHIRTHTGEKPFSCLHCQRAFADRSNLRAHLQTHSEVKRYQCACCLKTFSRISLLAKHQEAGCPLS